MVTHLTEELELIWSYWTEGEHGVNSLVQAGSGADLRVRAGSLLVTEFWGWSGLLICLDCSAFWNELDEMIELRGGSRQWSKLISRFWDWNKLTCLTEHRERLWDDEHF